MTKATMAILAALACLPCWAAGPQGKRPATVDLMPKAIFRADCEWKQQGKALVVEATWPAREVLSFDYSPAGDEYDLYVAVERTDAGTKDFDIGIIAGNSTGSFNFDCWDASSSCLKLIDSQEGEHVNGVAFRKGKPRNVKVSIRKSSLAVEMDGRKYWSGKVPWEKVSTDIKVPEKGKLFLAAAGGAWKVSAFSITPAGGDKR